MGAYQEALEKELPLPIKQPLSTQYVHIQTSHDYVKAARDSRKWPFFRRKVRAQLFGPFG